MDLIDAMYANEMGKREESHSTYIFQMQNNIKNDSYITINAWKYEVYAWLRNLGKKVPDVTEQDIQEKANTITSEERKSWWLYARALILSEFYGVPLRMAYDRDGIDGVPADKFRMIQEYGRVSDAYYKYQIQEQGELEADGRVKKLEPVRNNDINKIDIDVTQVEIQEWNKILTHLQNMLKNEKDPEKVKDIQRDIQRAQKAINDLSSKK